VADLKHLMKLNQLPDNNFLFDLIVIGGGITGAGVARDAALRGLSCLLLEKGDFASGVTSKTTRLIHGGLRYLANLEMGLVAESLRERAILRKQVPYLINPMSILMPIYRGDPHGRAVISMGIHLYDMLSHEKDIPHYFTSGRAKTLSFEPRLSGEGLQGCAMFYDHQIRMPERLVIENLVSAQDAGATLLNYVQAEKIVETRDSVMVTARDLSSSESRTYRSRVLINAAGPWIDSVREIANINDKKIIYPTKGIHLVMQKLSDQALFVTSRDGRMFFVVPMGAYSLIGTTDTKYKGNLDEVHAEQEDVNYLLNESRRVLPGLDISRNMIFYTYAGIRPLAFTGDRESRISRKHRVIREGISGRIITIAGGKLTTYRKMAKDVVDVACRTLGKRAICITAEKPLAGGLGREYGEYMREAVPDLSARYNVPPELVHHLIGFYGARAVPILEIAKTDHVLRERISPESWDIYAQVLFSIRQENARTLTDIILRRMHLGMTGSRGLKQIEKISSIAAQELLWNNGEKQYHIQMFSNVLEKETACLHG
jgi:glycerol-3-phosphate dehydrogenase